MTSTLGLEETAVHTAPPPKIAPINHEWTLYYEKKSKAKVGKCLNKADYLKELEPVGTFKTVENFWSTWNQLLEQCNTKAEANYHMFKDDIKPLWEDPKNSKGGKWVIPLQKDQSSDEETIRLWMSLMLALVSGDWGVESEINGIVLQSRPWGSNFSIWNRNANDKELIDVVSNKLRQLFNVDNVKYQKHETTIRRNHPAPAPKRNSFSEEDKTTPIIKNDTNTNQILKEAEVLPSTKIETKKKTKETTQEPKTNNVIVSKSKKSQLPEIDITKVGIVFGIGLVFSLISWATYV